MSRIVHRALKVEDLERTTRFYCEVFGFSETSTDRVRDHTSRHLRRHHRPRAHPVRRRHAIGRVARRRRGAVHPPFRRGSARPAGRGETHPRAGLRDHQRPRRRPGEVPLPGRDRLRDRASGSLQETEGQGSESGKSQTRCTAQGAQEKKEVNACRLAATAPGLEIRERDFKICAANSEEVVDRAQRQLQHVGLPTACAVVYWQISGAIADPHDVRDWQALLNAVARALAGVVPVYAVDGDGASPVAIAPADLLDGSFSGGAHHFNTKSGKQLRGLSVQRGDMMTAISVFKSAGITFAHRKPLF